MDKSPDKSPHTFKSVTVKPGGSANIHNVTRSDNKSHRTLFNPDKQRKSFTIDRNTTHHGPLHQMPQHGSTGLNVFDGGSFPPEDLKRITENAQDITEEDLTHQIGKLNDELERARDNIHRFSQQGGHPSCEMRKSTARLEQDMAELEKELGMITEEDENYWNQVYQEIVQTGQGANTSQGGDVDMGEQLNRHIKLKF